MTSCSRLRPNALWIVDILNVYLSHVIDSVFEFEGTLDKFRGDGVIAVFGAPVRHEDDPARAVRRRLAPTHPIGRVPSAPKESAIPQKATRQTVLVVDDDAEVRAMFCEYLRLSGFHVLEARNGLEALLHVKRERPHAIILDLAMPRLGGIDALKRIVKFDPTVAVIVVTGETDPDLHHQASLLGVRAILTKPVDPPDLLSVLTRSTTPRPDPGPRVERSRTAAPVSAPRGASPARVLVVDDEPDAREMLSEFATLNGYVVRSVSNGADAIRAVVEDPPDVVLLDIEMPGLAGADALMAIRAVAPDVKIIVVSGTLDTRLTQQTLARGAFDYVVKPVDMGYLAHSVQTAVTMKRLES